MRRTYQRLGSELEAARAELPTLAAAVATARSLVKERAVVEVIEPSPESAAAARSARELLVQAIGCETDAGQRVEALKIAHARVERELTAAVEAARRADEASVLAVLEAGADADRVALRDVLDRIFLRARLRGLMTHAAALLPATLGPMAITGEGMVARSTTLFAKVLSDARKEQA